MFFLEDHICTRESLKKKNTIRIILCVMFLFAKTKCGEIFEEYSNKLIMRKLNKTGIYKLTAEEVYFHILLL